MDFVNDFIEWTSLRPSPVIFRKWAAISILSASLERRVWITNAAGRAYPNLFVMLIGRPGTGKEQAMSPATKLLQEAGYVTISPQSFTKAKLLDLMEEKKKSLTYNNGKTLLQYSSMFICVEELGTLLTQYDKEMISFISFLWNNPAVIDEGRRHSTSVCITNPQVSGLVGTQPGYISTLFPEEMWEQGFAARAILVYAYDGPQGWDMWNQSKADAELEQKLIQHLKLFEELVCEVQVDQSFKTATSAWINSGCEPQPKHHKLTHYNTRRKLQILKLSIIAAASRGDPTTVTGEDFEVALNWLLEAEAVMGDIFKEMSSKSDKDLLDDLRNFAWLGFTKSQAPMHQELFYRFLSSKIPAERVGRVFELAVKMGILESKGQNMYLPRKSKSNPD